MNRQISKIIKSQKLEIMPGKSINAPLPSGEIDAANTSPFILLHHFGPLELSLTDKFAFEPHPHRGFDAVTILFEGEMQHRDSTGGKGSLNSGDVQWMSSGSGILHEESQPEEFLKKGGTLHGIQLWINVPKENKMNKPKYQDIRSSEIPVINSAVSAERLIAGNYKNHTGPAKTFTPVIAVHGSVKAGGVITGGIPDGYNSVIYVTKGSISTGGESAGTGDLILFKNAGDSFELKAAENSEYLLLAGEPINEPVVQYGPFVMNTMGEIKQAFLDYREGKFGVLN